MLNLKSQILVLVTGILLFPACKPNPGTARSVAQAVSDPIPESSSPAADPTSSGADDATNPEDSWDLIQEYYQRAKDSGEKVSSDVYEWAKQDFKKMGSWEYRILSVAEPTDELLETELNKLGEDPWECFRVETVESGKRLYLKRPVRSYLRSIPALDLFKLIPKGDGGSAE